MSVALFAPGWTHETASDPNDLAVVSARESAFWRLLKKHIYLRGLKLEAGNGPTCLFSTSFARGLGKTEADKWWLDISAQGLQTSFPQPHPQWPLEAATVKKLQDGYSYCADMESGRGARVVAEDDDMAVPLLLCEIECHRADGLELVFVCGARGGRDFGVGLRVMSPGGECHTERLEASPEEGRGDLKRLVMQVEGSKEVLEEAGETLYFPYRLDKDCAVIAVAMLVPNPADLTINYLSICHR